MSQNNRNIEMTELNTDNTILEIRTGNNFKEESIKNLNRTIEAYSGMFYESYYHYARINIYLFFIPTVLSAISGSLVFSDLSEDFSSIKWFLGSLSLIGGIFPNIEKAFKINDNANNCLKRFRRFEKISLKLDEQTFMDDSYKKDHNILLKEVFNDLNQELSDKEDFPIIPRRILNKFRLELSKLLEERDNMNKQNVVSN